MALADSMAFSRWLFSDRPLQGSALQRAWIVATLSACFFSGLLGTLWITTRFDPQPFASLSGSLFQPTGDVCEVGGLTFCRLIGLWQEAAIAFGIPIGLIQQQVLRQWIDNRWLWVLITIIGWTGALFGLPLLTYGLFASTIATVIGSTLLIAAGSTMGYLQGALLRSHLPQWQEWWLLQTVMAIAAVLLWSLVIPLISMIGSASILLFALVVLPIYALLSGNLLAKIRPVLSTEPVEAD